MLIVIVNVVWFIIAHLAVGEAEAFRKWGYVPLEGGVANVLTSMFMHGGHYHLIGNMLFLWMFGDNVEDVVGPFSFVILYLVCGYAAAMAHMLSDPASTKPLIGASGAVSGMLGIYLAFFPRAKAELLVFFLYYEVTRVETNVEMAIFAWFVMQIFLAFIFGMTGISDWIPIAFWAHIGGFICGVGLGLACRSLGYLRHYYHRYPAHPYPHPRP